VDFSALIWIVVISPLAGAGVNGIVARRSGVAQRTRRFLALVGPGAAAAAGWALALSWWIADPGKTVRVFDLGRWISGVELPTAAGDLMRLEIAMSCRLDGLSAMMVALVVTLGILVHLFAVGFEKQERDEDRSRLFANQNLLLAGSLAVVLAGNLPTLLVGWELTAVASFLLIVSDHRSARGAAAGTRMLIVSRIGAAGLLLAIAIAAFNFGTLELEGLRRALLADLSGDASGAAVAIGLLVVLVGVIGSAQLPFHVWLTESVHTPVSASAMIVSVATVAAGVQVMLRFAFVMEANAAIALAVATVGGATFVFAAMVALVQLDIRKLIGHVAVAQLGLALLGIAAGAKWSAVFLVVLYALCLTSLVLGSGVVVRSCAGARDLRRMGGLSEVAPVSFWSMFAAAVVLAGVPPLGGFVAANGILARIFDAGIVDRGAFGGMCFLLWGFGLLGSALAAVGLARLVFMVFFGRFRGDEEPASCPAETVPAVVFGVAAPALAALFGGAIVGLSGGAGAGTGIEWTLTAMTALVVVAGIGAAARIYVLDSGLVRAEYLARRLPTTRRILLAGLWIDDLYRLTLVRGAIWAAARLDDFDARVVDGFVCGARHTIVGISWLSAIFDRLALDALVRWLGDGFGTAGRTLQRSQVVYVQGFVVVMVIGAAVLLGIAFAANV
jgi:NADH-quinone oxidoreductase subunit L